MHLSSVFQNVLTGPKGNGVNHTPNENESSNRSDASTLKGQVVVLILTILYIPLELTEYSIWFLHKMLPTTRNSILKAYSGVVALTRTYVTS